MKSFASLLAGLMLAALPAAAAVDHHSFPHDGLTSEWELRTNPGGHFFINDNGQLEAYGLESSGSSYSHDKIAYLTGIELGGTFVASADITVTKGSNRWAGIAFHVQPNNDANNQISYYTLIGRWQGRDGADLQFRRYDDGALTVLKDPQGETYSVALPESLLRNTFYRFTVTSNEPGIFHFVVVDIDEPGGEVTGEIHRFTATDHHNSIRYSGGYGGLHANSEIQVFDNFFAASHPEEVAPPETGIAPAHQVEFFGEDGRFYQIEVSADASTWQTYGDPILGSGAMEQHFVSRQQGDHVRVVTSDS